MFNISEQTKLDAFEKEVLDIHGNVDVELVEKLGFHTGYLNVPDGFIRRYLFKLIDDNYLVGLWDKAYKDGQAQNHMDEECGVWWNADEMYKEWEAE